MKTTNKNPVKKYTIKNDYNRGFYLKATLDEIKDLFSPPVVPEEDFFTAQGYYDYQMSIKEYHTLKDVEDILEFISRDVNGNGSKYYIAERRR